MVWVIIIVIIFMMNPKNSLSIIRNKNLVWPSKKVKKYDKLFGTRQDVWDCTWYKTTGGLINKNGKIGLDLFSFQTPKRRLNNEKK